MSTRKNSKQPWLNSYPEDVDWHAEIPVSTLPDLFDTAVDKYKDKICSHFLGKTMHYSELADLTNRIATGLQASGVKAGDKVGMLLPNCPYYMAFYFAALKIGCVVVNYNPLYTVDEIEYQAKDSETSVMVTLDLKVLFDKVAALLEKGVVAHAVVCPFAELLPGLKSFLFKLLKRGEIAKPEASSVASSLLSYEELISKGTNYAAAKIDPDKDIAVLQYTGGTTGVPKGAMLTHANITANLHQIKLWFPDTEDGQERIMAILPFFHVYAMTGIMTYGLARGFEIIMMVRFEIDEAIKLIRTLKPTILPGVPTLFNALMNSPKLSAEDCRSLRYCISGGAPLPLEVRLGFEKKAECKLVEGYGLSETSPAATTNPPEGAIKENSIGQPMPGTTISIRDLEDPKRELPVGEDGEVCIAGPQVMKGYWQRPQETKDAFVGKFFRTGDVGHFDEDGFIYLIDRIKDLIICSGYNVYPRRIEDAIYEFPAAEEVTVLGIPDEYRGEAPIAFVKLKDGENATKEELLEFLKTKLSAIEMPERIEFRDELPKTMVGKLSKKELREELEAAGN